MPPVPTLTYFPFGADSIASTSGALGTKTAKGEYHLLGGYKAIS